MKKLAFLFVVVSAISFASCGNGNQASTEEATDTTEVAPECCDTAACCDTVAADTVVAEEA